MKKLQVLLTIGLLVAVGNTYRYLNQIESNNHLMRGPAAMRPGSAVIPMVAIGSKPVSASQEFSALVKIEADAMSQLNDHPEEIQKRLKDLASKMKETDIPALQETALNTALNGDQRFLSVYILGESSLLKAQEGLETIATSPIPALHDSRLINQEEVIRGQAVESLRQPESLNRVLSKSDNAFITDRAQRNMLYRQGRISSTPEQQDQEALAQLLKKTTH